MRADLHIHSTFSSDGRSTVEEIINAAVKKGFGCIAISDHNSFASYEISSKFDTIIVIPAEEVSSAEGHILAYGINTEIPRDMSVPETIDLIHSAGGIAVAAHPYRWWSGLGEKNVVKEFDAIETFNARCDRRSNEKANKLAAKMKKPCTAGSDAHLADNIGGAYIELPEDVLNWEDAVTAIMKGSTSTGGTHRTAGNRMRYGTKSIKEWAGRGFRRM